MVNLGSISVGLYYKKRFCTVVVEVVQGAKTNSLSDVSLFILDIICLIKDEKVNQSLFA